MPKVVYRTESSPYNLSDYLSSKTKKSFKKMGVQNLDEMERHDPRLVQVVEELHPEGLAIKEIAGRRYIIEINDGNTERELVMEPTDFAWIDIPE